MRFTTATCNGPGSEVAFYGGGEDEVGELVPGAEDAEDLAAVAEDEEEFFYRGYNTVRRVFFLEMENCQGWIGR